MYQPTGPRTPGTPRNRTSRGSLPWSGAFRVKTHLISILSGGFFLWHVHDHFFHSCTKKMVPPLWSKLLPGPPIPLEFLLIKKISTYILRIEKFTSMNGKNRRIRIFSSIVMWPCGVVCAYIMFDLPLNATECQKNVNWTQKRTYPERIPKFGNFREMTSILPRSPERIKS